MSTFPRRVLAPCLALLLAAGTTAAADEPAAGGPVADEAAKKAAAEKAAAEELAAAVRALQAPERETRLAAATAVKDRQDEALLAPLVKLLKDDDPMVRIAAAAALGARENEAQRKKAAAALHPRIAALAKKTDPEELAAVVQALHDLAQPNSIRPLLDGIDVHTERADVRPRLMAVANVPSLDAIDALIGFAAKGSNRGSDGQRQLAREALAYATGERLHNLDEWHVWWSENRKTFDVAAAARRRAEERAAREEKAEKRKARQQERRGAPKEEPPAPKQD